MKTAFFLLIFFVLSVNSLLAQDSEINSKKIITVCPFQIGERGRAADFRFNFSYTVDVGISGKITKIEELASTKKFSNYKFVRDDLFVDCMKKWRLEPTGKYYISFYVGTSSLGTKAVEDMPDDYMQIIGPNKQVLIVELSLDEKDLLKIQ